MERSLGRKAVSGSLLEYISAWGCCWVRMNMSVCLHCPVKISFSADCTWYVLTTTKHYVPETVGPPLWFRAFLFFNWMFRKHTTSLQRCVCRRVPPGPWGTLLQAFLLYLCSGTLKGHRRAKLAAASTKGKKFCSNYHVKVWRRVQFVAICDGQEKM